jgi:hypothetical protein
MKRRKFIFALGGGGRNGWQDFSPCALLNSVRASSYKIRICSPALVGSKPCD